MAQDTTSSGVAEVLTIEYEPGVRNTINQMCPLFRMLRREGSNKLTKSKDTEFAIKTQQGNTMRVYDQEDPDAFDTYSLEQKPGYTTCTLNYRKIFGPYRLKLEVLQEATAEGAHFDVAEEDLNDLAESFGHLVEWQLCTSAGHGYLFRLNGDPGNGAAASTAISVDSYGGWDGEDLGVILENLNLEGQRVQFVADANTAPRDGGMAYNIEAVDIDNDTITVTRNTAGNFDSAILDNDYVVLSRSDKATAARSADLANSNQTSDLVGLPGLVDDFGRLSTFQTVTSSTAPRFKSHVLSNSGVARPLTQSLLQKAISIARVRQPGKNSDVPTMQKWKFICHDFQRDDFALQLTSDRRYTSPLLGRGGVKAYDGWDMGEMLMFDGIPFVTSQLALRNSVFLLDTSKAFVIHNGPAEGQFLVEPGGSGKPIRIDGTPKFEYVWWAYMNFAMRQRNSSVRIDDLETITGI